MNSTRRFKKLRYPPNAAFKRESLRSTNKYRVSPLVRLNCDAQPIDTCVVVPSPHKRQLNIGAVVCMENLALIIASTYLIYLFLPLQKNCGCFFLKRLN